MIKKLLRKVSRTLFKDFAQKVLKRWDGDGSSGDYSASSFDIPSIPPHPVPSGYMYLPDWSHIDHRAPMMINIYMIYERTMYGLQRSPEFFYGRFLSVAEAESAIQRKGYNLSRFNIQHEVLMIEDAITQKNKTKAKSFLTRDL